MGHVHQAPGPLPLDHVADHMPRLPDGDVARLVALATAYSNVRGVLVALAGLSVLQATGQHGDGDVEAIAVGLSERLDLADAQLAAAGVTRQPLVRNRVNQTARAVRLLRDELEELRARPVPRISLGRLHRVHALLRSSVLAVAGIRELSSTSCASWQPDDDHGHHHDHDHHTTEREVHA